VITCRRGAKILCTFFVGAHTGHGLGQEFLRHCERSRVLVHMIDGTSPRPVYDYEAICNEKALFNPILAQKPQARFLMVFQTHY
jgi:GTPase involved in cell partitioning and DNA repair